MSNKLEELISQIQSMPETVEFLQVIEVIDSYYNYTPTGFSNGPNGTGITNQPGENQGSCKIFAFAQINKLDREQTLNCFGHYYRQDVLHNPEAQDHANIRTFMKHGWKYISFENAALKRKE